MRIVEFICNHGHTTHCNLPVDTSRFKVEKCGECGEVVEVWWSARFRHAQPGAGAKVKATFVANQEGKVKATFVANQEDCGDWVEERRQEAQAAHDKAEHDWGTANWWRERDRL